MKRSKGQIIARLIQARATWGIARGILSWSDLRLLFPRSCRFLSAFSYAVRDASLDRKQVFAAMGAWAAFVASMSCVLIGVTAAC